MAVRRACQVLKIVLIDTLGANILDFRVDRLLDSKKQVGKLGEGYLHSSYIDSRIHNLSVERHELRSLWAVNAWPWVAD